MGGWYWVCRTRAPKRRGEWCHARACSTLCLSRGTRGTCGARRCQGAGESLLFARVGAGHALHPAVQERPRNQLLGLGLLGKVAADVALGVRRRVPGDREHALRTRWNLKPEPIRAHHTAGTARQTANGERRTADGERRAVSGSDERVAARAVPLCALRAHRGPPL